MVVALVAFLSFDEILTYWFTKAETGVALLSSKISSFHDLFEVFTEPVFNRAVEDPIFYRPIYRLSFSLDYAIWGLEPFGYHLTDLLLHMTVAYLLFHVVYLVNGRSVWPAGAAGIFYSLNPLTVEVIPAVNHRQESLAALFMLAGLWLLIRHLRSGASDKFPWGSLLFFILAMGSKETGVIFFPLILGYIWLHEGKESEDTRERLLNTLFTSLPFLLVLIAWVGWWGYVTGGAAFFERGRLTGEIGGNPLGLLLDFVPVVSRTVVATYFEALCYPFSWFFGWGSNLMTWPSWVGFSADTLALGAGLTLVGIISTWIRAHFQGKNVDYSEWIYRIVLTTLFLCLITFPFWSPILDSMVHRAYTGEGAPWLRSMMDSIQKYSLTDYQGKARLRVLTLLTFASVSVLLVYHWRNSPPFRDRITETLRNVLGPLEACGFYLWWLLVPLLFFAPLGVMEYKHAYHGIMPMAALSGTLLVRSGKSLWGLTADGLISTPIRKERLLHGVAALVISVVVVIYTVSLLSTSPLLNRYSTWNHTQEIFRQYFTGLFHLLERVPPGSVVELRAIPRFAAHDDPFPHVGPWELIMAPRQWIKLRFPAKTLRVSNKGILFIRQKCPCHIWIESRQIGSHYFVLTTKSSQRKNPQN